MSILNLPEDCLSIILSLTTPRDIVRSSATSKRFLSASLSNIVWDNFIPSDIDDIIHRASDPIQLNQFATKKDLFLHISQFPLLLDNPIASFGLDKCNGKKCYMIAPRALWITWGDTPSYWNWESVPKSRFSECAVLRVVCWLEITGQISTKLLSKNTTYGVYFVFKLNDDSSGFRGRPVNVTVFEASEDGLPLDAAFEITKQCHLIQPDNTAPLLEAPVVRNDGWMEIEMATYRVGENCEGVSLQMCLKEVDDYNGKRGLVVNGVDLRPLV